MVGFLSSAERATRRSGLRAFTLYFFLRFGALDLPPALAVGAGRFLASAARWTSSFWMRSNSASSISWRMKMYYTCRVSTGFGHQEGASP